MQKEMSLTHSVIPAELVTFVTGDVDQVLVVVVLVLFVGIMLEFDEPEGGFL